MKAVKKYSGLLGLATFLILVFVLLRRPTVVVGTELGYRVPPGAGKELEDVVRDRVAALGIPGEVEREGGTLVVRIPDATPEEVASVKRVIHRKGKLEFRPAAERAVQEKFKADGIVPEGYEVIDHDRKDAEYAAWSPKLLIEKACALGGGRIVRAEPQSELMPGGARSWYVAFDLDEHGAKKFDETAARLYARQPTGLIAILLDGKLNSAPAVQTDKFGGSARITGVGGEQEAKDLAIVLVTGALPVPLDVAPEFERPFQKTR
jgi:preprotein translocase subunit SecD